MSYGTASHRLVKDLLYNYIASKEVCYQCGKPMSRDDFSIEHKEPWLDSEDPAGLFFNLENVAFSHLACNIKASRSAKRGTTQYPEHIGQSRTRSPSKVANDRRRRYDPEKRRAQYRRTGK